MGEAGVERLDLIGRRSDVPLAEDPAMLVTGLSEYAWQHHLVAPHAATGRIPSRHQPGPRRRADRVHIEAVQLNALFNKTVKMRRLDLAAVIAHVGPAKIVGHDDDDVRLTVLCSRQGGSQQ